METTELDNDTLQPYLDLPKEEWVDCRWINVDGLSYDVIQMLGNYKKLHRLAIEDLMYTRGRTKADWYSDHAFSKCTFFHRSNMTMSIGSISNCCYCYGMETVVAVF